MNLKVPELAKINRILFFTVLISVILYFGREIFILLTFAAFLAMLVAPLSGTLEKHRFSRILSSLISILVILGIVTGIIFLVSTQVSNVVQDMPEMKSKLEGFIGDAQRWISDKFGVSIEEQTKTLKEQASSGAKNAGTFIAGMLKGTSSFVGGFLLMIVFTFLFLLHREKYKNFIAMLYKDEQRKAEAIRITEQASNVARQYLTGRIISMFILAILYFIGFTIVGLRNALLLSIIAALLTFVPYVGPLVGGLIPLLMAIMYGSGNTALWVLVILTFAQLFDNYFIEPYIVGPSVNIGPFFTIFILVLGGVVWGIAGVILFLPLLGIFKIIFENVEGLKPYAYLIGDENNTSPGMLMEKLGKLFKRKKR